MPTYSASRELLASRADVWKFLSEPFNLPDWWPGIGGVQPDRRGFAPGARWQVVGEQPSVTLPQAEHERDAARARCRAVRAVRVPAHG